MVEPEYTSDLKSDAFGYRGSNPLGATMKIDNLHKSCRNNDGGTYEETSIYDDWEGTLHCTKCKLEVKRWTYEKSIRT